MTDKRYKVWFYIDQELEPMLPALSELCGAELQYDFENVWEWMEGHSNLYGSDLNISRDHGGMRCHGIYKPKTPYAERPVMIMFLPDVLPLDVYKDMARRISQKLKVVAYFGTITIQSDDSFISDALGSFEL